MGGSDSVYACVCRRRRRTVSARSVVQHTPSGWIMESVVETAAVAVLHRSSYCDGILSGTGKWGFMDISTFLWWGKRECEEKVPVRFV